MPKPHPVKVELAKRGQTQRSFARKVGLRPSTLGHILNGHLAPWPAVRQRIAKELGLSEDELFRQTVAQ